MKLADFEKIVAEELDKLPKNIFEKMDNVAIVVEKGTPNGPLLGLYQGVPKNTWGRSSGIILPDKITIFQVPLERSVRNKEELRIAVRKVIIHEIAHHFGFDEKGARKMEKRNN
jgi:predicted Zn-dependent protease with MMP-like domain